MLGALLTTLLSTGIVEVIDDRPLAVALYKAARDLLVHNGWEVLGRSHRADDLGRGTVLYYIEVLPPFCDGGCGARIQSPTGMCYQCQCEAHAEGWYSMDDGRARCGRSDAEIHQEIEFYG